jgi:hypothetical protein
MTLETRNSPLLPNGLLTHVSLTSRKSPLLAKGSLTHVFLATDKEQNNRGTIRHGDLYSVRPEVIRVSSDLIGRVSRVEAGSNNSTVTLRVVGGDEMGIL